MTDRDKTKADEREAVKPASAQVLETPVSINEPPGSDITPGPTTPVDELGNALPAPEAEEADYADEEEDDEEDDAKASTKKKKGHR